MTLTWAKKGRLIEINGVFSANQKQQFKGAYDAVILASYQRLALAMALRTDQTHYSPITFLSLDLLQLIVETHTLRSTTPSDKVLEGFKIEQANITHPLPSAADEKQAATMSLAQKC